MANIPFNVIEAQIYSLRIQESTLTWVLKRTSDLISPSTASGHATSQAPDYKEFLKDITDCLLYTSPSPRDQRGSRMPSSA